MVLCQNTIDFARKRVKGSCGRSCAPRDGCADEKGSSKREILLFFLTGTTSSISESRFGVLTRGILVLLHSVV